MPRPRPLTRDEARRTLAHRFAGREGKPGLADRLRQLSTKFGLRSQRVFLVWTKFTGEERGEGDEHVIARVEILPTPKVEGVTAQAYNPFSAGKYPVGSVRVTEVSAGLFTYEQLVGSRVPGQAAPLADPIDFFYELVEDGRGDDQPRHPRYRLLGVPERREGNVSWSLVLERAGEELDRRGRSQIAGGF